MKATTVRVLVIEDDEVDLMAIKRGFARAEIAHEIIHAKDGLAALQMLRGERGQAKVEGPLLVLLDLNLPRMNGFEFLHAVRKDAALKGLVVFVLTTSAAERDRQHAYAANVAGYIVKSDAGHGFAAAIGLLEHFWRVVELP